MIPLSWGRVWKLNLPHAIPSPAAWKQRATDSPPYFWAVAPAWNHMYSVSYDVATATLTEIADPPSFESFSGDLKGSELLL
jgi:hypothetical protein